MISLFNLQSNDTFQLSYDITFIDAQTGRCNSTVVPYTCNTTHCSHTLDIYDNMSTQCLSLNGIIISVLLDDFDGCVDPSYLTDSKKVG